MLRTPLRTLPLLASAVCSCGGLDPVDTTVTTSGLALAPGSEPVQSGVLAAVLVGEADAGATDLNGDGDTADSVAAVVDLESRTETVLGLAAVDLAILGSDVYVVVDVAAQTAGGAVPAGAPAFELWHWRRGDADPTLVDGVDAAAPVLATAPAAVFYAAFDPPAAGEASLSCVEPGAPKTPLRVPTLSGEARIARPRGVREGLVLLALPEGEGPNADLNGDGDEEDAAVLGWVDGTALGEPLVELPFALPADGEPFDAERRELDDWLVAFLVSEDGQGVDLDDPALFPPEWVPEACPGLAADAADPLGEDVLFVTTHQGVLAGNAAENTGIAGRDRVVAGVEFAATLSDEATARCDLNGDGAPEDTVARWVHVPEGSPPGVPPGAVSELVAVSTGAGPSMGVSTLGGRLVVVVDEAADSRDWDGDATDRTLVASRLPGDATEDAWSFEHQSGVGTFDEDLGEVVTSVPFVGASWMAADEDFSRLALAYQESVSGLVLNRNDFCDDVPKDSDATDTVASWARARSDFERASFEPDYALTFPGVGYALADDPGLVVAGVRVFLRVSEAGDARDYNGDGDQTDTVVIESGTNVCFLRYVGESTGAGGPVAYSDGATGVVFASDEAQGGVDLNGDGDTADHVLRYFRF